MSVWFKGNKICADMPALILVDNEMIPMWREGEVDDEKKIVCVEAWRKGWTIVRTGSGWGRRRGAKYFYVDFTNKTVAKLRRSPTKNIETGRWMDCLKTPSGKVCLEWIGGRLVVGPVKII